MVRMEPADAAQRIAVFGSVLALTWPPDLASATFLVEGNRFIEATSAPSFDEDTYELLTKKPRWGKSLRMLACGPYGPSVRDVEVKKLVGGFLLQERDPTAEAVAQLEAVTK